MNGDWTDDGETLLEGLTEGDTFDFSMVLDNETQLYTFEVSSVGDDSVVLDVNGDEVTLTLNESITVDLNADGVDDVEFSLVSIDDGVVDIQMNVVEAEAEEESWFKWWYLLILVVGILLAGLMWWFASK